MDTLLAAGNSPSSRLSLFRRRGHSKYEGKDAAENSFCSQIWYYFQFHILMCPNELNISFLFVFVSRVRLIVFCCLSLFVVLFTLFATWLLTQHFNKNDLIIIILSYSLTTFVV